MPVDDALDRCQPDPSADKLRLAMQALKHAEQALDVFHIEAGTVIANEVGDLAKLSTNPKLDFRVGGERTELPGVGQQVLHHHPQQYPISLPANVWRNHRAYLSVRRLPCQIGQHFFGNIAQIHSFPGDGCAAGFGHR